MIRPDPIHQLPDGYREVEYFSATDPKILTTLTIVSLVLTAAGFGLMAGWMALVYALRTSYPAPGSVPGWVGWIVVVGVFLLHEWVHGLAIRFMRHRPRYGALFASMGRYIKLPVALYATTDHAYFPRDAFIFIALAPLVVITLAGMGFTFVFPDVLTVYIALAVALNAGGAVGDVLMVVLALRYPPEALVRDEIDSMRIYVNAEINQPSA